MFETPEGFGDLHEAVGIEDGCMLIADRPGLGVTLHPEAIARHPYEARDLRHYRGDLTDIRPADATAWLRRQSGPAGDHDAGGSATAL